MDAEVELSSIQRSPERADVEQLAEFAGVDGPFQLVLRKELMSNILRCIRP
jgi:hypothetical protein